METPVEKKKVNLGGGPNRKEGFINIDRLPYPEVDIVADLNKGIPLADDSVDELTAFSILEHVDDTVFIMEEIYRVCRKDAKVTIIVPYLKSTAAFKDPTHKRFFSERTFEYFDKSFADHGLLPDYDLKCNLKIEKISYKYYNPSGARALLFNNRFFIRFFWDIIKTFT
ncbi:MAG: methyltransferase domain-containing protein, partial [Candidatus Omnitrophica bacterium]|nr:methyltransferase domain-containing protein [Candidatus Omnitrophota bacterium]